MGRGNSFVLKASASVAADEKPSTAPEIVLEPISEIFGTITLPGSKSLSNRILLLAALSEDQLLKLYCQTEVKYGRAFKCCREFDILWLHNMSGEKTKRGKIILFCSSLRVATQKRHRVTVEAKLRMQQYQHVGNFKEMCHILKEHSKDEFLDGDANEKKALCSQTSLILQGDLKWTSLFRMMSSLEGSLES
ncbi:3-phosphoshikimate 1-carboxyvinyltransferase [Trifolium repens]|nr:3-phosphoshikimate 1-carboxyvinyltransferase [Trifolium repens]